MFFYKEPPRLFPKRVGQLSSVLITPIVFLLHFFLLSVQGAFDPTLTIISKWERLEDQKPSLISCMSAQSSLDSIQFDRVLNTGQESTLPSNHIVIPEHDPVERKTLYLYPSTDDKDRRFGAFSCYVVHHNVTTRVVTLKQPSEERAEVIPRNAYLRTSLNESITIFMRKKRSHQKVRLIWRHKGDKQMQNIDHLNFPLRLVKPKDAGIYELFYEQRRKYGVHGIMRLIVRDCPPGRYGHMCESVCPLCLNGGVCHERYGTCICSPGFSGTYCERPCGKNRLGPSCSWKCDYSADGENTGCNRHLICLPDPYGCSCASGFYNNNCADECTPGRFGADCAQVCRCNKNSICDPVTGMCPEGCQEGWKGDTCQQQSLGPVQNLQVLGSSSPDQMRVLWKEPRVSHGIAMFVITWQLVEQKACLNATKIHDSHEMTVHSKTVTLRDLVPYSLYEVTIYARSSQMTGEPSSIRFTTAEKIPAERPLNADIAFVGPSELDFTWNPIPCSKINGYLVAYESELSIISDTSLGSKTKYDQPLNSNLKTADPYVKFSNLIPYKYYRFRVRGVSSVGGGPWSESVNAFTQHSTPPTPSLHLLERTARTLSIGVDSTNLPVGITQKVELKGCEQSSRKTTCNLDKPQFNPVFSGSSISSMHNYTVTHLQPFTMYVIEGRIFTNNGWSSWSSSLAAWTDETYPSVPTIKLIQASSETLQLKIIRPNPTNGIILQYQLRVAGIRLPGNTPSMPIILAPEETSDLNYTVRNLKPSTRYQIQVQASTSIGWGNWSEPTEFWTSEGAPGAPTSLILLSYNESSIFIQWQQPKITNGKLVMYEIFCEPISTLYPNVTVIRNSSNEYTSLNDSIHSLLIKHLQPLTYYRVKVRATTHLYAGEMIEQLFMTGLKIPNPPICYPKRATDTAIPILIEPITAQANLTSFYQIIIEKEENNEAIDEKNLFNFTMAEKENLKYYIALEVETEKVPEEGLFLYVGDNHIYNIYWNAPLQSQHSYYFRLRILFNNGDNNHTVLSPRSKGPLKVRAFHAARVVKAECHFYDPQCLWFPFVVVGCAVLVIWTVVAIVAYRWMAKKNTNHKIRLERGSSSSIAWSVAYRKGYGTSNSEASTLVKDQAV